MKTGRRVGAVYVVCLIAIALTIGLLPRMGHAAETVKIGLIEAKSGPFEPVGRFFTAGFMFAVDEQNAKGGLLGKKIEVLSEDSEFKGDVANRKAKKLLLEDKVNIITSGGSSAVAIALNKVATEYKTLYINHGGMSDDIQGKEFSRYGFRVVQNMYSHYAALALAMAEKPYRRFYLLGPDYLAAYSANEVFKAQLKKAVPSAQIVGEDYHPLGATRDFGPYISKIVAAKADAVVISSFGPDLTNAIRQARSMGLKAPFPFLSHVLEPYPINELKDNAVGMIVSVSYDLRINTPENQQMIKSYHEKHKGDRDFQTWWPTGLLGAAAIGWKATFAAIEKAGSLDPEKVIAAYEGFQYKSPVGLWTMRKCDHQMLMPMYNVEVVGGPNPWFDGSINPEIKFPWTGPRYTMTPADKVSIPMTPAYNARCQ